MAGRGRARPDREPLMAEEKRPVRVLLVDDERDFLLATARALQTRGFSVETAASAEEARGAMRAGTGFDVAVLDVALPDGDGHRLFLELRRESPDLAGIVLTGHPDPRQSASLAQSGLCAYIDKPCDVEVLSHAILEAHGRKNTAEAAPAPASGKGPEGERVRLLLIDDEVDFVKSLSRVLARRGIEVHGAFTGEDGLRVLDSVPVDVAVVDLKMPGMSGLEVLRRIKAARPGVRVILLTGHGTMDAGLEGMKLGAEDFLLKPQDPEDLIRKIEYAASRKETPPRRRWWWPFGRRE
jgi:DNA-binding NtrC family response regulator